MPKIWYLLLMNIHETRRMYKNNSCVMIISGDMRIKSDQRAQKIVMIALIVASNPGMNFG